MIAYNLIALFRTFVLREKHKRPYSLRYRTSAVDGYFQKSNDKIALKIAPSKKEEINLLALGTSLRSLNILPNFLMRNWVNTLNECSLKKYWEYHCNEVIESTNSTFHDFESFLIDAIKLLLRQMFQFQHFF